MQLGYDRRLIGLGKIPRSCRALAYLVGVGIYIWIRPGQKTLPTKLGYCSNANCVCRFGCGDGNIDNLNTIVRGR